MRRVLVLLLMAFGMATLWSCQNRPGVPEARVAEHLLLLEKVKGNWLISDFDDTKEHAIKRSAGR